MPDKLKESTGQDTEKIAAIPGTRMEVNWEELISAQDIILTSAPQNVLNGLLLGNGDIGVSVFGAPEAIHLHVGKNDLWDYRDPMDEKRPITQKEFLETYADPAKPPLLDYIHTPNDAKNYDLHKTYRQPMPTIKPAGQIRFRNNALSGSEYSGRVHLWNAEGSVGLGESKSTVLRTFVSYPRNLIVAEYLPSTQDEFTIELARHQDTTGVIANGPEFGVAGRDLWVRYRFPADPLNYPQGFEYVMYARVIGGDEVHTEIHEESATIEQWVWGVGTTQTIEGAAVAHIKSAQPITLLVAVVTTRDDTNPFARAQKEVDEAATAGLVKLKEEHQQTWHDYWRRSFVQLTDNPWLTRQWFFSQYFLAISWRAGKLAPGLFGAWTWEDFPAWGNDYHWDYNMQQAVWGAYSSNHLEQTIAYNEAALNLLPTAMTDAQEVYELDGAKFFLCSYPRKYLHNPFPVLHYDRMMSLSAWVAQPMWLYYLYSQNMEYLRTEAYPLMRECTIFYAGFLTEAEDGKYDIWPTAAWDVDLTPHLQQNKNCLLDLALIHYLMKASIEASEILKVDQDKRAMWQHILDNLREYPTTSTTEGDVFVPFEGAAVSDYVFPISIAAIFPGSDIGLHSPELVKSVAWRTAQPIAYAGAGEQLLTAMARVRLGSDEFDAYEEITKATTLPNGGWVIEEWRDRYIWIHECGAPIVINESLLQSYNGYLQVAPVKLKSAANFGNLRTEGAFLVSGELLPGGHVKYLAITSEAGKECALMRPWEGDVRVREFPSMHLVTFVESGDMISFATTIRATYVIDRPTEAWEAQPVRNINN